MDITISELEVQHELQRFTTRFVDRITQCTEALQASSRPDVRDEAMRKNLLYASSAMEIATGPSAAINLLDMFVFVHLTRHVLETHWIPTLYGSSGAELGQAFSKAEEELVEITRRATGPQGHTQLVNIVDTWLAENPNAIRVEGMRLGDFAAAAGAAASDRALQARSLLSSVKVATAAANQAMVIAERGMFLFHRLPFLWRLQIRLAVRDVVDDALRRIRTGSEVTSLVRFARRGAVVALFGLVTASLLKVRFQRKERCR